MIKYGTFVKALVQQDKISNAVFQYLNTEETINLISSTKFTLKKFEKQLNLIHTKKLKSILSAGLKKKSSEEVYKLNITEKDTKLDIIKSFDYEAIENIPTSFITLKISKKLLDKANFAFFHNAKLNILVVIRRAWIDPKLNFTKIKVDDNSDKKLDVLIQKINISTSFDDNPNMMFMRHKKLQDEIKKHDAKPLEDNKITKFYNASNFAIMLFEGGDFTFAVYNELKEVIHKSEHKYVIRKKGGGKQSTKDKTKSIKSVGSTIRRENERMLSKNILQLIQDNSMLLTKCEAIFLYAPGLNSTYIVECFDELGLSTANIVSIGFPSQKAKYQEVKACYKKLSTFYVIFGS